MRAGELWLVEGGVKGGQNATGKTVTELFNNSSNAEKYEKMIFTTKA